MVLLLSPSSLIQAAFLPFQGKKKEGMLETNRSESFRISYVTKMTHVTRLASRQRERKVGDGRKVGVIEYWRLDSRVKE